MTQVYARYKETHAGRTAMRYAFDFARVHGCEALNVLVPRDGIVEAALAQAVPNLMADMESAVRNNVQALVGASHAAAVIVVPYEEHTVPALPGDAILVDAEARETAEHHCIYPANESHVEVRRNGPVLVTFSDGETGLVAAQAAFELIKRRRAQTQTESSSDVEVIFYHTTWPDPDAHSSDPLDHICEAATRVMLAIQTAAREQDINFQTVVQTERDVAQGVLKTANNAGCIMIVMDRSEQVSQGSYVDRIIEQSPIPVFVAGPQTEPVREAASFAELAEYYRNRRVAAVEPGRTSRFRWVKTIVESSLFSSPLFVMSVTALMYIYKSVVKVAVGLWVNSPTVLADGFHNIADLLQAVVVAIVNMVSSRPSSQRYPYGHKNIESFASLVIGVLLFVAAFKFTLDCVAGLLSYWPQGDQMARLYFPLPAVKDSAMTVHSFPWVLAVGISSVILSLLVSRYEILIGKRSGHASMIADGEETRSDGWIEGITIIGIIAEFTTGWRIIEFPLGLMVAWMIRGTAWELFMRGWRVLLQHSLGAEREDTLRTAAMAIPGVIAISDLKTFQVGNEAVVMVTIDTLARSASLPYVKESAEKALRACLLDPADEFKSVNVNLQFNRPDACFSRIGYAVCLSADGEHDHVAPSLGAANALAVCDVERAEVVRTKVVLLEGKDITSLLLEKRLHALYVLDPSDEATLTSVTQMRARAARTRQAHLLPATVVVRPAVYTMSPLGVILRRKKASKPQQSSVAPAAA